MTDEGDTMSHHTVVVRRPAEPRACHGSGNAILQRYDVTAYDDLAPDSWFFRGVGEQG